MYFWNLDPNKEAGGKVSIDATPECCERLWMHWQQQMNNQELNCMEPPKSQWNNCCKKIKEVAAIAPVTKKRETASKSTVFFAEP